MVTTAHNYPKESNATAFSRFAIWISRFPLVVAAIIFTAISAKFLFDPVRTAAERGIMFSSGAGITIGRVGFGAFPLAFAIITIICLASRRRILAGLYIVSTVIGAALVVRVLGMLVDNSAKENIHLVIPEVVLLVVCYIGVNVELRRRRREGEAAELPQG